MSPNFRAERPDFGNPNASDTGAPTYERLPDIEQDPDAHDLTSWAMEPGDWVFFHGMMIHGGSGSLPPEHSLEVFGVNWLGDDVTVKIRPKGMDPDLSAICAIYGLRDGDPIGSDAFPVVWPKR